MPFKNYTVVFRRPIPEGNSYKAQGFASLATTPGIAIQEWLEKTDYELEDLISIREVFATPEHDKFYPS